MTNPELLNDALSYEESPLFLARTCARIQARIDRMENAPDETPGKHFLIEKDHGLLSHYLIKLWLSAKGSSETFLALGVLIVSTINSDESFIEQTRLHQLEMAIEELSFQFIDLENVERLDDLSLIEMRHADIFDDLIELLKEKVDANDMGKTLSAIRSLLREVKNDILAQIK